MKKMLSALRNVVRFFEKTEKEDFYLDIGSLVYMREEQTYLMDRFSLEGREKSWGEIFNQVFLTKNEKSKLCFLRCDCKISIKQILENEDEYFIVFETGLKNNDNSWEFAYKCEIGNFYVKDRNGFVERCSFELLYCHPVYGWNPQGNHLKFEMSPNGVELVRELNYSVATEETLWDWYPLTEIKIRKEKIKKEDFWKVSG